MRRSRLQKFIWNGLISQIASLKVISNVAKFHAFIIKLKNSMLFWWITRGLIELKLLKRCIVATEMTDGDGSFLTALVFGVNNSLRHH